MATQIIPRLTEEEYLALDRTNAFRSEYIDGEMLAMSGGSDKHSLIAGRLATECNNKLAGRKCFVFNSDMRVRIGSSGAYVYPDLSIVCGERQIEGKGRDILLNPAVIVEVLSPSTEYLDRGRKFDLYREIPSLNDYLLVRSDCPNVSLYSRQHDNSWLFREATGVGDFLAVPSLSITLELSQIYIDVTDLPG